MGRHKCNLSVQAVFINSWGIRTLILSVRETNSGLYAKLNGLIRKIFKELLIKKQTELRHHPMKRSLFSADHSHKFDFTCTNIFSPWCNKITAVSLSCTRVMYHQPCSTFNKLLFFTNALRLQIMNLQ